MKTFFRILLAVLGTIMLLTAVAAPSNDPCVSIPTKGENYFGFKTDREFVGASVEIIHSNGDVVIANTLQKRKMIINFSDAVAGAYVIRIKKGNTVREFRYVKLDK